MIYLSGAVYKPILTWEHGGIVLTPEMGNCPNLEGVTWLADNGCYTAGARFSTDKWLQFLWKWRDQGHCVMAVAPDVPFDMGATLKRSIPLFPLIRRYGYPIGLAIQNGIEHCHISWEEFDAVFIAGDKAFKTSRIAREICDEAKRQGKHVHIARRNSYKALQEAQGMQADTVDGTYLAFGPDKNWPKLQKWFTQLRPETQMELW